ncbi:MAG: AAA family ATPase [Spirochaetales bacterium]
MIRSLRFDSGYPRKLPGIGTRTIEFGPRINIVFGPNGAGKSTMLNAIANEVGCGSGGWNTDQQRGGLSFPFQAKVSWDNEPVFFQDCYADSDNSFLAEGYLESHDFLRSSGEVRIGLINELVSHIERRFVSYRQPRDKRPTLLLDEVDNHIGLVGQSILWREIFGQLSKKYQLIVSTHSVFPLLLRRNNAQRVDEVHELVADYKHQCLAELAEAIDYYNERGDGSE